MKKRISFSAEIFMVSFKFLVESFLLIYFYYNNVNNKAIRNTIIDYKLRDQNLTLNL